MTSVTVTPTTADTIARVTVERALVARGEASVPIALAVGANAIHVVVTAQNGTEKTYTVTVTRAPAAPSLALAVDTGALSNDGITQNGRVNVTGLVTNTTWKYSTNSGGDFTSGTDIDPDTSVAFFTLPDGVYVAGTVQVVQTLLSVDSAAASFDAVTVDNIAPEIEVNTAPPTITQTVDEPYTEQATATDNVDASVVIITSGELVNPNAAGRYRLVYTATDVAGNAVRKFRLVLVQPVLAFTAGEEPALTSDNAGDYAGDYAIVGDILSLTFSVNVALANPPSVTIAGQSVTAVKGTGNSYTATYTVAEADVADGTLVTYDIGAMTAANNPANTLDPEAASVLIQIDVSAPTATLDPDPLPALFVDGPATVRLTIPDEGEHQSLELADFTADNAKDLSFAFVAGVGHDITFTPLAVGAVSITFNSVGRVTDSAGNVIAAVTATGSAQLSADADLSGLTIADNTGMAVALVPTFVFDQQTYTASVLTEITSVTVTPTTNHIGASVSVGGNPPNQAFSLDVGANDIAIVVTAADSTEKTYAVNVTRAEPPNRSPVADAGADQSVPISTTPVTLDGTGSNDPDGTIQSYVWVHTSTDGVAPTTALTVADGVTSTFTAPASPGVLVFTLTVTDDDAATNINTDTNTVTIAVTMPFAVTIRALGESTVGNPASVRITFAEAVTGLEKGDFPASDNATVNSIDPATGSGTTFVVTYTPSTAGAVTLTLAANAVTDGNGNPNSVASATGSAAVAATETTTQPGFTATTTISGLTTAEFDEENFERGIATVLSVPPADVHVLSIAAGSVVVVYEVVADTDERADALETALSDATDAALRAAIDQGDAVETKVGDDSTAVAVAEVILSEIARAIADQNISAIARRVEHARAQPNGTGFNFAGQQMSFGGNGNANGGGGNSMSATAANLLRSHGQSLEDDTLDMKSLLGNSEFSIVIPAHTPGYEIQPEYGSLVGTVGLDRHETTGMSLIPQTNYAAAHHPGTLTFWGSGDYRNLSGEDDDLTLDWDGDMFSLHLGVDTRITADAIGGVALSWNEGEMDHDDGEGTSTSKDTYDTSMVSINPYLGWSNAHGEVWLTAGIGAGELESSDGSNDLSMQTLAIGGTGVVWQRAANTMRVKGEFTQSSLEADDGKNGGLDDMEVDVSRARLSLESTSTITWGNGAHTDRKMELGVRHDGGDGTTGSGAELGFGVRHVNASGLSVEGKARVLLLGYGGDINEWGISGTIKQTTGADGQGFSFALSPGYGDDASDLQNLLGHGVRGADGNASNDAAARGATARARDYSARLDARIGYGINGFTAPNWLGTGIGSGSGTSLLTPYTAMTLSNGSNRYRLGLQWKLGDHLDLDLVGERRDAVDDNDAILLKGELRF